MHFSDHFLLVFTQTRRLKNYVVHTILLITCKLLDLILFEVDRIVPQQIFLEILKKKFFALAYCELFRIGEVTCSQDVIWARNVHLATNKDKLLIALYSSKRHGKESIPQVKIISWYHESKAAAGGVVPVNTDKIYFFQFTWATQYIKLRRHLVELQTTYLVYC